VKVALRRLARRHQHLTTEITDADAELHGLVATAAPGMPICSVSVSRWWGSC
jgi:transposase